MDRVRTALYLLAASIVVTIVALTFRSLTALGVFTDVTDQPAGTCIALHGVIGAEDMQPDREDGLVFVSATDRRTLTRTPDAPDRQDGLYTFSIDHPERGFTKLSGTPENFHPHGLSLYRGKDGSLTLMVVNHPVGADSSVDIFDVKVIKGSVALTERADVTGGLIVSPNDVAAVGPDQFYVTNDHTSKSGFGRTLEAVVLLPRANVVYFDGSVLRVAAAGLNFANGIALSNDGAHLYVASTTERAIHTYERNPVTGSLHEVGILSIPSGLDNIDVDEKGNPWVAGHPKLLDSQAMRDDPNKVSPSQIFEVSGANGIPVGARLVYANNGEEISGASIGAIANGHLFMSAPLESKILDCTLH